MTRHEFLAALHEILRPATYLEVGVQYGTSLNLAVHSTIAIGIDPEPLIEPTGNQTIVRRTSDYFFADYQGGLAIGGLDWLKIDMAFIDGMHLFEYALRDFCNIEKYCHPGSVVVFDDVFPRNQWEARRLAPGDPVLGDWTGDVWKIIPALSAYHPCGSIEFQLVDTEPTGSLVVSGFPEVYQPWSLSGDRIEQYAGTPDVPDDILTREGALDPAVVLHEIKRVFA